MTQPLAALRLGDTNKYSIVIDKSRDSLFDEHGLKRLRESYMLDSEESPQERFAYVSRAFASNQEHAQRLYEYASNHTPLLSYRLDALRRGCQYLVSSTTSTTVVQDWLRIYLKPIGSPCLEGE
jgi:hypothetical protein